MFYQVPLSLSFGISPQPLQPLAGPGSGPPSPDQLTQGHPSSGGGSWSGASDVGCPCPADGLHTGGGLGLRGLCSTLFKPVLFPRPTGPMFLMFFSGLVVPQLLPLCQPLYPFTWSHSNSWVVPGLSGPQRTRTGEWVTSFECPNPSKSLRLLRLPPS